ncbi:hypothetical protein HZA96_01280 [Candidatus Woesearchaeota archaeon]|nr:hypothetical protein [Candidatus Woesearchaeota archaeon]
MGLFGFGKNDNHDDHAQHGPPQGVPVDKVIAMRQQGLSNSQIIQLLQRNGYESTQVFDAMNQADIKGTVELSTDHMPAQNEVQQMGPQLQSMNANAGIAPPLPQGDPFGEAPPMGPGLGDVPNQPQSFAPDGGYSGGPPSYSGGKSPELERMEELAEAIIDEKWNEIVRSINKIIEWKDRVEGRITKVEQEIDDMKKDFTTLHTGVLGKIGQYDQNLSNIAAEIKAMDKVFSKVLPVMTENVNELSRITRDLKTK